MYKYQLGNTFYQCPVAWQNFILSVESVPKQGANPEEIQVGLNPFNATQYITAWNDCCLIFETEEDAMAFVLRWS